MSLSADEGGYHREDFVIETKFGEVVNENGDLTGQMSFNAEWVKRSLDVSLKRLNLDYIDLFATHGGEPEQFSDDMFYCLEDLKSQGLIRAYGSNTFDTDVIEWISKEKAFDYVMLDYNIMRQDREDLIEELYENGVGVIGGAALAENLYSKRVYRIRSLNDIWYLLRAIVRFNKQVKEGRKFRFINKYSKMTGNQIALRYVLDNQYVTSSVFNTTNPEHLYENVKSTDIKLPNKIKEKIISEGKK